MSGEVKKAQVDAKYDEMGAQLPRRQGTRYRAFVDYVRRKLRGIKSSNFGINRKCEGAYEVRRNRNTLAPHHEAQAIRDCA